jgi:hypothetical protein
MRVALRCFDLGMPKNALNLKQGPARVDEQRRKRVTKVVNTNIGKPSPFSRSIPTAVEGDKWAQGIRIGEHPRAFVPWYRVQ